MENSLFKLLSTHTIVRVAFVFKISYGCMLSIYYGEFSKNIFSLTFH